MNILNLTMKQASEKLRKKEISSLELVEAYINASNTAENLNLYITKTFEKALEEAKDSDKRRANNQTLSDIDGIPIGVKDIFLVKDVLCTNASKFLTNFVAPYESTVTSKLKEAGYICLGKLNMDEFAMGSSNLTSHFGGVINPWHGTSTADRVPGGSSGASAAGIAARAMIASLGTDTGGSVRQPAAFCGVVGMKPTYGTCSRYGIIAFASSLDQAGPLTRNVEDNAMLLQHMAGYDEKDSTMLKFDKPNYASKIGMSIKGMKIGIPKEYYSNKLSEEMKNYWNKVQKILLDEGAEVVEISLPNAEHALAVYYIIAPAEASSNFARFDGIRYGQRVGGDVDLSTIYKMSRTDGWGSEVKRRILVGAYNLLNDNFDKYVQATKVRRLVTDDFINAFKKVDMILTPVTPEEAFAVNDIPDDPISMYLSDLFTVPVNLAGVPALSLPVGLSSSKVPVGIQLIGNYHGEPEIYQVASVIEKKVSFNELSDFVVKNKLF